jgi:glycosyltransferase involved in cell wall biosynthesis
LAEGRPLVTICVPTIGRTATLGATLRSVSRQSYTDCEVLLLDNAAPAEGRELLDAYARSDPRARILRSSSRLAMFDNFQRGVDAASGRYVTFFHDDDIYAVEFVARHVELLEAHPSVAFSGSNCTVIDGAGAPISNRDLIRRTDVWDGWRYIRALFALGNNVFPMQSAMFRRSRLSASTFDPSQGVHYSDYFILMRMAEEQDVGLIGARLLELRSHDDQASQQLAAGAALELRTRMFYEFCDELESRWPARAQEVEWLRRRVRSARRSAAVWMWTTALSADRATAAKAALDGPGMDRWVRWGLSLADRSGASRALRNRRTRRRLQEIVYSLVARYHG